MTRLYLVTPVDAFSAARARELAEEIGRLCAEVDALVGRDPHVRPRTAAVMDAVASLLAEIDQVRRDAQAEAERAP